jgi:O-antigen/teichoic acid export membrane protein
MPPTAQKTASLTVHVSWLLFAKTLAFAFTLALPLLLVRKFDLVQFGVYKQLFLIINTSVVVLPMGFAMSAYYFLPREPDRQGQTVWNIFLYNVVIGVLACIALWTWPVLLDIIFHQPALTGYSPVVGVVILLLITSSALEILPIAHLEMKLASGMIVAVQLTRTSIYLSAALWFGSVQALLYAAVAHGLLQIGVLWWYMRSRFPGFWRRFDSRLIRSQLSYAVPLGLAGLLWVAQTDLHSYFVSNRLGAAVFAIYAVGTVQLSLMSMLQEATNAVVIPHVCRLQQSGDNREIILLLARAMRKLAAVYFPVFALLMVVAREFISFLFTKRYLASVPVFRINLCMLLLGILLEDPLFRAFVEQRFFLIRLRVVLLVLLVGGLWVGIARFGLMGAIGTVVLVTVTERLVVALRFGRILGVRRSDIVLLKDLGKLAVAAGLAACVAVAVRIPLQGVKPLLVLMACGTAFGIVYLGAILLAGILTGQEKEIIRQKLAIIWPRPGWGAPAN